MKRNISLLNRDDDTQNRLLFAEKDTRNSTPSNFLRWRIYLLVLFVLGTLGYFFLWSSVYPISTKADSGNFYLIVFSFTIK